MSNSSKKKQFGMNTLRFDPAGIRDPLSGILCRTVYCQC